jgi:hypothetical protein
MEESSLIVGHTYYRLAFADRDFTMPSVEPLVYLGSAEFDDGKNGHAFQEASSYIAFGSALTQAEPNEECAILVLGPAEVGRAILAVEVVAREVAAAAERAAALGHPSLPSQRARWDSAP